MAEIEATPVEVPVAEPVAEAPAESVPVEDGAADTGAKRKLEDAEADPESEEHLAKRAREGEPNGIEVRPVRSVAGWQCEAGARPCAMGLGAWPESGSALGDCPPPSEVLSASVQFFARSFLAGHTLQISSQLEFWPRCIPWPHR